LSYQANWELVVMWVHYNPVDLEIDDDNSFIPIYISNSRILVLSSSMSGMYYNCFKIAVVKIIETSTWKSILGDYHSLLVYSIFVLFALIFRWTMVQESSTWLHSLSSRYLSGWREAR